MGVASLDLQQTDAGQGKIDYGNIVNKPMINGVTLEGDLSTEDINIFIPQRVSELQNDAGYITKNVSDLVFYYDKTEVDNMISTIPKFDIKVVDALPTEDISPTTIYLLMVTGEDHFEEYIYVDDEWDKLGDGNIDLSDYATYEYVDAELAEKVDAADLATVALSGRYSDLIGAPVNLSQFTNDVGYLTEVPDGSVSRAKLSSALNADLTAVENAVEGLQNSVRGLSDTKADKTTVSALSDTVALKADKSELPTKTSDLTNDSGFITSADVPTNVSELTNDSGYITSAALTSYSTTQQMNTAISTAVADKADRSEIPTKVSDLTNDSGFVNSTQVNTALAAYTYPSQDLYTQSDIDTMLAQISSLKIEVVNTLPQTGNADTIYLLRVRQQGNDLYQEYFWVNNAWELIGGIDLTDYYTKTEVNTLLTAKADVSAIPTKTSDLTNDSNFAVDANYVHTDNNYTTAEKNKLAGVAAGAEVNVQSNWTQTNSSADDFIKNKPSIPTKTSDLTNDSGFITTAAIPTNVSAFNNDAGYLDEIPDDSVGLNQLDSTIVNALNNINNKANTADLASVAFSGDYDDLINQPAVPTKTSDLTNDSGFLSSIPIASSSVLGGIKVGSGLSISSGGVLSANGGGTADDVAWGHITGTMADQTDLTNALAAKANSADLAAVATSGDYDDLVNKPTVGNATLTIQKNGASIGTFTANATSNKTINIAVPTTAGDVSALPASTKYGASIAVSISTTDYKITTTLKDQDGNTLGAAQVIDLPLESVVVNGSYDSTNKKIVLTLQSGSTIDIPVADLVAGLQSEITSTNKLASDLVDDTNQTHKFMTSAEKTKLSGIAAGAEVNVQSDWNQTTTTADDYIKNKPSIPTKTSDLTNNSNFVSDASYVHTDNNYTTAEKNKLSGIAAGAEANVQSDWNVTDSSSDAFIKNKPTIPTVNNGTLTIQKNGTNVATFTANQSGNATANITVPTTVAELSDSSDYATTTDLAAKQNLLSPGNHIDITSDVISATGYVHSENPQAAAAASSTITGSMIANGTITADKLATNATVKLTMSTSDIGEGAPLAANTLYGVYR